MSKASTNQALIKITKRVLLLDRLIRNQATGSTMKLARKLGISQRQVFNYLHAFKENGKVTAFDEEQDSYIYVNND